MAVSSKDNSQQCISAIKSAIGAALGTVGQRAVGYAQSTVPVDTGALRDSIDYEATENQVTIYADMPYASYVELGTSRQAAQPYLKPSVTDHTDEYVEVIRNSVSGIL